MSAKTYAGLPLIRYSDQINQGQSPWAIQSFSGGDDDRSFRSRFWWPWSNSGPWFTVERITDVTDPSTDGGFAIAMRSTSSDFFHVVRSEGPVIGEARFMKDAGSNWSAQFITNELLWVNRSGSSTYVTYQYERWWWNTGSRKSSELPWSRNYMIERFRARDWGFAHDAYRWLASFVERSGYVNDHRVATNSRYASIFTRDYAPPSTVYSDVYDPCRLYLETGILPGAWARGWETAYTEACKGLPEAATNLAANVLEAAAALKSLFTGDVLGAIPKTAADAWLAYRYAYTTTKLDIREVESTFNRLDALLHSDNVAVYGSYTRGDIQFKVCFELDIAQVLPSEVSTTLCKFGLELNALNVWDMIPYSFVVDWFVPVGQLLEYFQDLDACRYNPKDIWFSLVTTISGYRVFARLPGRKLSTMPYLQLRSAGTRTVCLRIADAVALFSP